MSTQTVKVAVSLPKGRFKTLEDLKHKLSVSRSALVDEALRFWLESRKKDEMIEKYEKGYLDKPEDNERIKALHSVQVEVLNDEDWK